MVRGIFRFVNMGLAVMMAAAGAIGMANVHNIKKASNLFVGFYMIIFALIFFSFECIQIAPEKLTTLDRIFRRNFGFLYKMKGKSIFVIFIAFLNFGLETAGSIALATGIVLCINGGVQLICYLKWPELLDADQKSEGEKKKQRGKGDRQGGYKRR